MKYILPSKEINRLHMLGYNIDTDNCPKCKDRDPMCEMIVNGRRVIIHETDIKKNKI